MVNTSIHSSIRTYMKRYFLNVRAYFNVRYFGVRFTSCHFSLSCYCYCIHARWADSAPNTQKILSPIPTFDISYDSYPWLCHILIFVSQKLVLLHQWLLY